MSDAVIIAVIAGLVSLAPAVLDAQGRESMAADASNELDRAEAVGMSDKLAEIHDRMLSGSIQEFDRIFYAELKPMELEIERLYAAKGVAA